MSKTIPCKKCNQPLEFSNRKFLAAGIIHIPGYKCEACKDFTIYCAYIRSYEDVEMINKHIIEHNLTKMNATPEKYMQCTCGFKMEFITDLYKLSILEEDEEILLPGFLCQECENRKPHPYTVDFMKKIGV